MTIHRARSPITLFVRFVAVGRTAGRRRRTGQGQRDRRVGLRPFTSAQDFCERYTTGRVTKHGSRTTVDVQTICNNVRDSTTLVVAELESRGDTWAFTNFYYLHADGPNLRKELRILAQAREETRPSSSNPPPPNER